MVIHYHPLYMRRLAEIYIHTYGMTGHAGATEWFMNFLDADHRKKIRPYIQQVAEERNLEVE